MTTLKPTGKTTGIESEEEQNSAHRKTLVKHEVSFFNKRYRGNTMFLLPSQLGGKVKNFDNLNEYAISGDEFKSWNDDPLFKKNGLNAMYFHYTKPCKVEVEFIITARFGMIDVVSWIPDHPQFEVRPIVLHFAPKESNVTKFQFYANPFYLNGNEGYFEPRVYAGFHMVTEVRITKLLTLKTNKECKYALFLLKRAAKMLNSAKEEHHAGDYALSLHFSRFAIELSLKGIYAILGITFEKRHDIAFSENLRQRVLKVVPNFPFSRILWICQRHIRPARMDFYGDELGFEPSYSFVDKDEAENALNATQYCYGNATLLLDRILGKTK